MDVQSVLSEYIDLSQVGDDTTLLEQVARLSPKKVRDLTIELWANLPSPSRKTSPYRYVGNSTLSGLPYPCMGHDCRARNVAEVANFAAMYADEVVLINPFARLVPGQKVKSLPRAYYSDLALHISMLLLLAPLISRGIVSFEHERAGGLCNDCFNRVVAALVSGGSDEENANSSLFVSLMDYFLSSVEMRLSERGKMSCSFEMIGAEALIGHDVSYFHASSDLVPATVNIGDQLTKEQILNIRAADDFAYYTTNDVMKAEAIAIDFGVDSVLSSGDQLDVFRSYFGEDRFSSPRNVDFPLVGARDIETLLKFRDQEWHHLEDFRGLVQDGLKDGASSVSQTLSKESAKMQGIVAKNRRGVDRALVKDGAILVAGLTLTAATAGVSGILAAAIGALSGGHIAKDIIPKIIDRYSEPEELRDHRSYYAWKIRSSAL